MNNPYRKINLSDLSRVYICLVDHPEQRHKIRGIIRSIRDKFKAVTYSRIRYKKGNVGIISDSAYKGYYFDEDKNTFILDDIHLIFVDINTNEYSDYLHFFNNLQEEIRKVFREKEAWITIDDVKRVY